MFLPLQVSLKVVCEGSAFLALPSLHVSSKFRARARVYFARPTIAIAKIRDYSQSISILNKQTPSCCVGVWSPLGVK